MKLLSDDDLDLSEMSDDELAAAWDLWFDLAQATGVFVGVTLPPTPCEPRPHTERTNR